MLNDCRFDDQNVEFQNLLKDHSLDNHASRRRIGDLKNNWFQQNTKDVENNALDRSPRPCQDKKHCRLLSSLG